MMKPQFAGLHEKQQILGWVIFNRQLSRGYCSEEAINKIPHAQLVDLDKFSIIFDADIVGDTNVQQETSKQCIQFEEHRL